MLGGLVSPVEGPPTVDAASYWCAFAAEYGSRDAVEVLMSQRRRGAVYARPSSAVAQLKDVAAALTRGIDSVPDRMCLWQGQVFAMGDFLAVWAVENVVHHLDLAADTPVPGDALELARMTIEALAGQVLPSEWSDEHAVLIGTGRLPLPEKHSSLQSRLPALG
jgi:hypothetical protein